jgi:hypothetical protein
MAALGARNASLQGTRGTRRIKLALAATDKRIVNYRDHQHGGEISILIKSPDCCEDDRTIAHAVVMQSPQQCQAVEAP